MTHTLRLAALALAAVLAGPIAAQAAIGVPDSLACEDAFWPGDEGHEICFWSDPLDNVDKPADPNRAFESLTRDRPPLRPVVRIPVTPQPVPTAPTF